MPKLVGVMDASLGVRVYQWPDGGPCARCGDETGWYHDADGARRCRECQQRTCAICFVKMSVHTSCVPDPGAAGVYNAADVLAIVDAALESALAEVRRQGGAGYLLVEAQNDGIAAARWRMKCLNR